MKFPFEEHVFHIVFHCLTFNSEEEFGHSLRMEKKERWDSLTTIFAADGHQPALPDYGCQRPKTHEHEAVAVQVWVFGGTPGETYRGSLPESSAGCRSEEVRHWRGHLGWWNVTNAKGLFEQPSHPVSVFLFLSPPFGLSSVHRSKKLISWTKRYSVVTGHIKMEKQ